MVPLDYVWYTQDCAALAAPATSIPCLGAPIDVGAWSDVHIQAVPVTATLANDGDANRLQLPPGRSAPSLPNPPSSPENRKTHRP